MILIATAGVATAQPAPAPTPAPPPTPTDVGAPPTQWVEWDLTGQLIPGDDKATLEGLLQDTMETHRALTPSAEQDIADACKAIGYEVLRIDTPPAAGGGVKAVLVLDPIPMIRSVDVVVHEPHFWSPFTEPLYDDEIKHRLRIRPGAYLPYEPAARKTQLDEETARIEDYLHDEGYFDAKATIALTQAARPGLRAKVSVTLGRAYKTGRIKVAGLGLASTVSVQEVANAFVHEGRLCLPYSELCLLEARFTRAQHQADIAALTRLFQSRGFHAVKVTTDFDPATSFDRRTGTVQFTVHVSERRQTDVVFQGNDPDLFPESALKSQLTFDEAGSVDDFEIEASAAAIQRYYQSRGHFDAQVTFKKESTQLVDHVFFFIEEGPVRELKGISFAAVDADTLAISESDLLDTVGLKTTSFFGGGAYVSPTAEALADDADRIRRLYVQDGYGDARVAVRLGPDPDHLGSASIPARCTCGSTSSRARAPCSTRSRSSTSARTAAPATPRSRSSPTASMRAWPIHRDSTAAASISPASRCRPGPPTSRPPAPSSRTGSGASAARAPRRSSASRRTPAIRTTRSRPTR